MSEISLEGYSPMDPAKQQDPFPYYAALRDKTPVYQGAGGIFFISGHAEVLEVLRQPETFSSQWGNTAGPPPVPGAEKEVAEIFADAYPAVSTMLTLDPPLQTRYRKAVGKAFSTRRILSQEPRIREMATALIESWPAEGRVDFMREMSIPFPVRVIANMLSIPPEHEVDVKRWSDDSVASIGVKISVERALESARGIVEMQKYIASLLEDRQQNPRDDFLSEMVNANFEDLRDAANALAARTDQLELGLASTTIAANQAVAGSVCFTVHFPRVRRFTFTPSCGTSSRSGLSHGTELSPYTVSGLITSVNNGSPVTGSFSLRNRSIRSLRQASYSAPGSIIPSGCRPRTLRYKNPHIAV